MWENVPVIMTTNKLPKVMREPKPFKGEEEYENIERYNNYMAFMTRCRLHLMKRSHKNAAKFPYTAEELAIYMKYLCNKICPAVDEVYISDSSESLKEFPGPVQTLEDIENDRK
jgi:hypothetical protein